MPDFREITIKDRELFQKYLQTDPLTSSELTFVNFFIWRAYDRSTFAIINDDLCVRSGAQDQPPYFFPPLGGNKIIETIDQCLDIMKQEGLAPLISRIPKDYAEKYLAGSGRFNLQPDRDNFDYIYLMEELCLLKGRKFSAQRNHLKNFLTRHDPRCLDLKAELIPACRRVLDNWAGSKEQLSQSRREKHYLEGAVLAAREILDHWDKLGLTGVVVFVEDQPVAFAAGEKINPEMAVAYLEIVNRRFQGLNQYINKEFSCRLGDLKFVNREQDLGFPGLRKAKLAYHPHYFIKKYNLTTKENVSRI